MKLLNFLKYSMIFKTSPEHLSPKFQNLLKKLSKLPEKRWIVIQRRDFCTPWNPSFDAQREILRRKTFSEWRLFSFKKKFKQLQKLDIIFSKSPITISSRSFKTSPPISASTSPVKPLQSFPGAFLLPWAKSGNDTAYLRPRF